MQLPIPSVSVPADPRLKFDWVQNAAPFVNRRYSSDTDSTVAVQTQGQESESFQCYDADCTSSGIGTGSTYLPATHVFTKAGSGAVYRFGNKSYDQLVGSTIQSLYYASSVTYPDGETLTFGYDTATVSGDYRTYYRPTSIHSSTGYYITITYVEPTFNPQSSSSGIPQKAALYGPSDPNTPLSQLIYSGYGTTTITDLANRTFTCTGCTQRVDDPLDTTSGSMQLPSESGVAMQYSGSAVPNANYLYLINAATKDGVQWTYSYTNPRAPSCTGAAASSATFDRLTVSGPSGYNVAYDINPAACGPASIAKITDGLNRATSYGWDSLSRLTNISYPEGNSVAVTYDGYSNIISKVTHAKPGSGLADITETAFVDNSSCQGVLCYRPVWMRDGLGRETDFTYNAQGQVTQETDPADANGVRRATYITYDASNGMSLKSLVRTCGISTTCGTNAEIRTQYTYIGNTALVATETRVDNVTGTSLTTTYSYDAAGRLLVEDGPLSGTADAKYYRYDVLGRKTWEIGPADVNGNRQATIITYRAADDKVTAVQTGTVTDPINATGLNAPVREVDTAYDSRRNPVQVSTTAGGTTYEVTSASFDDRGQPICSTVRMNAGAFGSLPADACALGSQGSYGPDRVTKSVFDAGGQLLQVQKAVGTPLQQNYATYTYSQNGKQTSVTDANGNLAGLAYDGFDRLAQWTFPSPTTAGQTNASDYEAYGYDAAGNRTSLRKRDGVTLTYAYDGLNRMVTKSVPASASRAAGYTVSYGYDVRGLETSAVFGNGQGIANSYDGFGRLTASTTTMGGVGRTLSSQYDAGGSRTALTWPDGQTADFYRQATGQLYYSDMSGVGPLFYPQLDSSGRIGAFYRWDYGASWGLVSVIGYDAVSRVGSIAQQFPNGNGNATTTFGYSPASQIVTQARDNDAYAWTGSVSVNRGYAVNGLNQYTSAGSATFAYDANGNLRSDGTNSYVYDAENRLVSASNGTSLAYDPMGRLWQTSSPANGTMQLLYDGDALVAEYDGSGAMQKRYVHSDGADTPEVQYAGAQVTSPAYLMSDHQGSIVALANSAGNLTNIDSYDEYGIPASGNVGRFGYTGQAWLPDLGMWYYKARIYSPTLGRFLQTDPVGYKDQVNLYAYVGNDPINKIDPGGMSELNLLPKSYQEYAAADALKIPGAFTVVSHGGINGVIDEKADLARDPGSLLALAVRNGYRRGELTFLAACALAVKWGNRVPSPYHEASFAEEYSNISGGKVIASTGEVFPFASRDGLHVGAKTDGQFQAFSPGSKEIKNLGTRFDYDKKTGQATFRQEATTGQLAPQITRVCIGEACKQ